MSLIHRKEAYMRPCKTRSEFVILKSLGSNIKQFDSARGGGSLRRLLAHAAHGFRHFRWGWLGLMRRDHPLVPFRIADLAATVTPKHVHHGHVDMRASSNGALEDAVHVVDKEIQRGGSV